MMNTRTSVGGGFVVVLAFGLGMIACGGGEPPAPCHTEDSVESFANFSVDKVDLLLMVDNTRSMGEERASLVAELPRLVRVLVSGDRTGDGPSADDFRAVKNLHVGVVTSDMGVAGFDVPTCTRAAEFGDDGLLGTRGATSITGCMAIYPKFLEYIPGVSPQTPEEFGADVMCIAMVGDGGCGFEQQLESPLKAVTLAGSSTTFYGGTHGHGDAENAGFVRPDSVLAVIVVTDEEDCSIKTGFEGIFDSSASSTYTGNLNLRCYHYPETQRPIQRYVDGFRALRPGHEDLVVFGAIVGVPTDLIPAAGAPDYDAILADPRMIPTVDAVGTGLEPSCDVPGRGIAFAPRRIVQVAQAFGEQGVVQSICQASFTRAVDAIVGKIAAGLSVNVSDSVCVSPRLRRTPSGLVPCDLVEVIPPPGTFAGQPNWCAELGPGVHATSVSSPYATGGRTACSAIQLASADGVAPTAGEGWYYDDSSAVTVAACGAPGQRIVFTAGAALPNGITAYFECHAPIVPGDLTLPGVHVGTFCDRALDPCLSATATNLVCEPISRTCQVRCFTTADCTSPLVCDASSGVGFCLNPFCGV